MPDGKCWMIDDLKLELTDSTILIPADSNVSANTSVTLDRRNEYNGNFLTYGYMAGDIWAQVNPGDPLESGTEHCVFGHMIDPNSITGCGYLYNWYTATAGSGTKVIESGYVTSSICPKGWHLPRGADGTAAQNEFYTLGLAMRNSSTSSPILTNTIHDKDWWHTGLFAGSQSGYYIFRLSSQGSAGYLWSSSAYSSDHAFNLSFDYRGTHFGTDDRSKYYGYAVRCLNN
jgi:uncharacterized protein (TIGR02145 family)